MQVSIPGHFVERVAVGMQHVAALAGPLDGQTGRAEVRLFPVKALHDHQQPSPQTQLSRTTLKDAFRELDESRLAGHKRKRPGIYDGAMCGLQEGEERSVIFMWGRGREGQLGGGLHADSANPSAVDELRGRHVLQVTTFCTI